MPSEYHHSAATNTITLALEAAAGEAGRAVIPLEGKEPTTGATPRGVKDASRDPANIGAMFKRAGKRATGFGIATGAASGLVVVDVDGPEARAEAERLDLTSGYIVRTGRERDGWHLYFALEPGVEVKSRTLAPGLEVKGEGSYVVGPGSLHPSGAVYELVKDGEPSPAPAWLLEALTRSTRTRRDDTGSGAGRVSPLRAGPGETIPEGVRNQTLFFEALEGKDRGLDHAANLEAVRRVNQTRCIEPLPDAEVEKITASAMRYQVRRRSRETAPEVLAIVEELERLWWASAWRGVGGKTERDVLRVLIALAKRYGTPIPAGVRVSVSVRTLALAAATHYTTVSRVLKRFRIRMVLRKDDGHRADERSGAVVLLDPRLTANTQRHWGGGRAKMLESVSVLSRPTVADLTTPCFRWRGHVGKGRAGVLYALESFGVLTEEELAEVLGWSRVRDLRRKYLEPLESLGLIEVSGDGYRLPDAEAYAVAVETVRAAPVDRKARRMSAEGLTVAVIVDGASEYEREQADREKHEEQRRHREERRCQYRSPRPEPSRERRERRDRDRIRPEERTPSGTVADLDRVPDPDPELLEALREYLRLNPGAVAEGPSWLAGTMWCEDRVEGKPTRADVEVALAELLGSAA